MKYLLIVKDPDSARWEWNILDGPMLVDRGFTSDEESLITVLQKFTKGDV